MADFVTGEWVGLKALYERIAEVGTQADEAAREIVTRSAALAERAAKANFEGSHKKGQPHVGGSKPNVVTGTLRRSIRTDPVARLGLATYGTTLAPRVIYARRVELGWQGKGAHPYFRPGVEQVKPEFRRIAAEVWRTFMRL